ncbi:hypothetical protein [Streptomyces sp. NPDC094049]|uniref:hypothetical protein n=1 Tax=Streptomyces sp. NPDC094049 TaxID=3154987 RepID=UPI00332C0297
MAFAEASCRHLQGAYADITGLAPALAGLLLVRLRDCAEPRQASRSDPGTPDTGYAGAVRLASWTR